jgi:hypothetical protein
MRLEYWQHDRIDLDGQKIYSENRAMSVLANAVELLKRPPAIGH